MRRQGLSFFLVVMLLLCTTITYGENVLSTEAAKKVSINKSKVTLQEGTSTSLRIKGTKKKAVWSSNRKKVVTVSRKGKITAKKVGKAKVTAKIGKKKYTCRVTVIPKKKGTSTQDATGQNATTQDATGQNATPQDATEQSTTTSNSTEQNPASQNPTTQTQPQSPSGGDGEQPAPSPSDATMQVDAGEYSLNQIHTGEGTYYDRETTGCANLDEYETIYYTAAMNKEDYMNGLAGAYVEVTDKDGDKLQVLITDQLPEGKKGDIDLTRNSFSVIEPLVTGRMSISWRIIPLPTEEPIYYNIKPDSTMWWAEVQVRNHRYPIKTLEYLDASTGQYVALERQEYNYFKAANGMGAGPYTFRVTDMYNHVLIDTGIRLEGKGTYQPGAANFPY